VFWVLPLAYWVAVALSIYRMANGLESLRAQTANRKDSNVRVPQVSRHASGIV
jgi:hypothetical protein